MTVHICLLTQLPPSAASFSSFAQDRHGSSRRLVATFLLSLFSRPRSRPRAVFMSVALSPTYPGHLLTDMYLVTSSVTYCEDPESILVQQLDITYFNKNQSVAFNISAASVVRNPLVSAATPFSNNLLHLVLQCERRRKHTSQRVWHDSRQYHTRYLQLFRRRSLSASQL